MTSAPCLPQEEEVCDSPLVPTDTTGDLPGREHYRVAGEGHHGQGVPTEGGADQAGVQDPTA